MGHTVDVPNGSANPRTATAMVAFNPADGSTVGGGYTSVVNVTRPGNTTPYDALDVVGGTEAALTFENIGPAGGHIFITDVDLRININAVTSGMAAWRLHLYSETPGSGLDDNVAFNLAAGDRATYLGFIDLPVPVDMGDTIFSQPSPQVPKKIKMGATTSLFGYLQTIGAYTPTSEAVLSVRLNAIGA